MLFQLEDGKTIESAYMLYEPTETSRERRTVCVSTQVGCSIHCPFCATGQQGFERSLTAGEIVEQVLYFVWLAQAGEHGWRHALCGSASPDQCGLHGDG